MKTLLLNHIITDYLIMMLKCSHSISPHINLLNLDWLELVGSMIDDSSISEFKMNLSYENWENVFNSTSENDVNVIFNNFLNMYLRIFYCNFLYIISGQK